MRRRREGSKKKKKRKRKEREEQSTARRESSEATEAEKAVTGDEERCPNSDQSQLKTRPGLAELRACGETKDVRDTSSCSSPTDSGIGSVGGAEPVAKELVDLETSVGCDKAVAKEVDAKKRKMHTCAQCGLAETVSKSFKRCQK